MVRIIMIIICILHYKLDRLTSNFQYSCVLCTERCTVKCFSFALFETRSITFTFTYANSRELQSMRQNRTSVPSISNRTWFDLIFLIDNYSFIRRCVRCHKYNLICTNNKFNLFSSSDPSALGMATFFFYVSFTTPQLQSVEIQMKF